MTLRTKCIIVLGSNRFCLFHEGFSSGLDKVGIEAKLQGKWLFSFFSKMLQFRVHPCLLSISINFNNFICRTNVIYYDVLFYFIIFEILSVHFNW